GLAQLQRIDQIISRKRRMGRQYTDRLKHLRGLQLPREQSWAKNVYWMYGVVLTEQSGINALQLAQRLQDLGVETRPFFICMHDQPAFRERGLFLNEQYPVAQLLARQGLYLPSGLALTDEQLIQVCDAVEKVVA